LERVASLLEWALVTSRASWAANQGAEVHEREIELAGTPGWQELLDELP
jgi:hypothetical protein